MLSIFHSQCRDNRLVHQQPACSLLLEECYLPFPFLSSCVVLVLNLVSKTDSQTNKPNIFCSSLLSLRKLVHKPMHFGGAQSWPSFALSRMCQNTVLNERMTPWKSIQLIEFNFSYARWVLCRGSGSPNPLGSSWWLGNSSLATNKIPNLLAFLPFAKSTHRLPWGC